MSNYKLKCQDGSDRNCYEFIDNEIDINNLSDMQLDEIAKNEGTTISKQQIKQNGIRLDKDQIKELEENDEVYMSFDVDTVCCACGSDQTYDDEGNNITADL